MVALKIETIPQEDHQVKIEAEFEVELFDSFKRRAARKIANKAKIPGFRPGKAPYDVILRMFGEGAINEEAIELLIDEQYAKVLDETSVTPSGPGSLQEIISMDPPKLSFLVPLKPEVELGDYKSIELEYSPEPVMDEEINEFITRLQKNYATAEPAERPIEKGDVVYFKLTGFENEEAILEETPVQLVIGEDDKKDNWPYEGFSNELIGMNEGDSKDIEYSFTEDAEDERFKGKTVKFVTNIQSVKTLTLPELDDEFANSLGQFENFAELEQAVREQHEINKKQEYDDKYYSDLIEKYAEISTVKFPPFMVEEEIEHMLKSLERDLKQQNLDFDTYLKLLSTDKEKYIEENVRPAAINRVKSTLIIEKVAQEEKVEVAKEDIDEIINDTVQMLQNIPDQKGKKAKLNDEMVNNVAYNAISRLYNQRTLERMKALASGETEIEATDEAVEESSDDATETVVEQEIEVESNKNEVQAESEGDGTPKE
ncbi:MAG: trigger factor [Chloroflexi bacterium HGW-Chloroflexi-3]|nr:MAG: trigger factor [Chloroflexi bacterium HGW-Chloroflexi-3]